MTTPAPQSPARPIALRPWEVRGLLDGRISQIRRPVRNPLKVCNDCFLAATPHSTEDLVNPDGSPNIAGCIFGTTPYLRVAFCEHNGYTGGRIRCDDEPGSLVWVKERYASNRHHGGPTFVYEADDKDTWRAMGCHWSPANSMKRHVARLTLEITAVRPELLQSISEADAIASGTRVYWESLNGRAFDDFERRWARWAKFLNPSAVVATAPGAYLAIWEREFGKAYPVMGGPWLWVRTVRVVPSPATPTPEPIPCPS